MVNDLTVRHLRGLTREQVVELLGPSDDPSVFQPDARQYPEWDLVYNLGIVDPFYMIGPGIMEVLVIRFGPGGRVREYRVGHDWKFRTDALACERSGYSARRAEPHAAADPARLSYLVTSSYHGGLGS